MGEYATHNGQSIKIGTCESMYYLRPDQAHKVTPEAGSVNPVQRATGLLFRFPFADEDHKAPGDFEPFRRAVVNAPGFLTGEGYAHGSVQLKGANGYMLYGPCIEESAPEGYRVQHNGWQGNVGIEFLRVWHGSLVPVVACQSCGAHFRVPTREDAAPLLDALEATADRYREWRDGEWQDDSRGKFYRSVWERIVLGFVDPVALAPGLVGQLTHSLELSR